MTTAPNQPVEKDISAQPEAPESYELERAVTEIDDWDRAVFSRIISTELSPEQERMVVNPDRSFPKQRSILAIHWHPEWIPLDLIRERVDLMFPRSEEELIIPTQHNQLMLFGDYAGVEVDCLASGFHRKVQLLLHFKAERVARADVLRAILAHTFKYRSGQLFEFIDSILKPQLEDRLNEAAAKTGANPELVEMTRFYTARLKRLIEENEGDIPPTMIKNKLLTEYLNAQVARHPESTIKRAAMLIRAVKKTVKRHFPLDYFFEAAEVIEEARSLGGGVVIPHPEQFWPILLADYDIDGVEVWNPQSREYTDFLIRALTSQNKSLSPGRRELLVMMGDDTHMSTKIKDPSLLAKDKAEREIGLQPPWEEVAIQKGLSLAGAGRRNIIRAYRERLG